MKFGPVPVSEAEGAILAHSITAGKTRLKKGRRLVAGDLDILAAAGVDTVVVAQLEADDVAEDDAAGRLATALLAPGLTASAPFAGRVNLYAESAGVVAIKGDFLTRLNRLDEGLTVGTLPDHATIAEGQMIATIKIIPFAVPEAALAEAEDLADEGSVLALHPFRPLSAGLVLTTLPGQKPSLAEKAERVVAERLQRAGSRLEAVRNVNHDTASITDAVAELSALACDPILVLGATATVDRRDCIPAGIEAAGGAIAHFGMPVDPGNLLAVGRLGDADVVILPGCARSPKLNGFDWVLERLLAGLPVGPEQITAMGLGGLLKEIPSRPQPRHAAKPATHAPKIAAILLAAGRSRRMGKINKLLEDVYGIPMIARVAEALQASQAEPVIAVTGHEAERIGKALQKHRFTRVHNPDYADGLSTSLVAGLGQLPPDCDGFLVCLGDMPTLGPEIIDRLIAAFSPQDGRRICVPTFNGKRGNPVLWDRSFAESMAELKGDVGAKHLIGENEDVVAEVAMDDAAVLSDIDTPAALAQLRAKIGG